MGSRICESLAAWLILMATCGAAHAADGERFRTKTPLFTAPPIVEAALEERGQRQGWVVPMYSAFATLQVLDVHSTIVATSRGARETNPLLPSDNRAALIATKVVTSVGTIYLVDQVRRKHPRVALGLMIGFNAFYTAIVVHNYQVARQLR